MEFQKLALFLILLIILTTSTKGLAQEQSGFYGGLGYSYEVMFTESRVTGPNQPFEYYLGGFILYGAEFGKHFGKNNVGGFIAFGSNSNPLELDPDIDFDGDIDLLNTLTIGIIYRKQITKYKESNKVVFNFGYRSSLGFYQYTGDQLFVDENRNGRIEDFTLSIVGVESGLYLELGKTPNDSRSGFAVNIEPIYVRVTNDGFGIGATKLTASLKF